MIVEDIIRMSKNIDLSGVSTATLSDSKLLDIINLGRIELYKRFALSTKAEVLVLSPNTNVYTLRNTDVMQILNIYDEEGKELIERSVECPVKYDYQKITYNTILISKEMLDKSVVVVYASSPLFYTELDENIEFPVILLESLLLYIAYKVYSGNVLSGSKEVGMSMYNSFESSCALVKDLGYIEVSSLVSHKASDKGFI